MIYLRYASGCLEVWPGVFGEDLGSEAEVGTFNFVLLLEPVHPFACLLSLPEKMVLCDFTLKNHHQNKSSTQYLRFLLIISLLLEMVLVGCQNINLRILILLTKGESEALWMFQLWNLRLC